MQAYYAERAREELRAKGKTVIVSLASSGLVHFSRNGCLGRRGSRKDQKPFQGMIEYDRLIWIDADNLISAGQIEKLISWDVDIAAAWYRIHAGYGEINDMNFTSCGLWDAGKDAPRPYLVAEMKKFAQKESLIEAGYAGLGLMVVKHGVFESMSYPWFTSWTVEWEKNGATYAEMTTDDSAFAIRAREHGFKVYVDPAIQIDHEKKILI